MALVKEYADGFVVREATPEDKDELCTSFNNVYGGMDYVEQMYDHYMENPKYHCFVGVLDGKIVSSVYILIKTVVLTSLFN